jgi:hypothetical protein
MVSKRIAQNQNYLHLTYFPSQVNNVDDMEVTLNLHIVRLFFSNGPWHIDQISHTNKNW